LIGLEREINILKEVETISDTFLSGFPAKHLSFIHKTKGLKIFDYDIWTIFQNTAYILSFSVLNKDKKKFIPIFIKMRDSFKITPPED
jgi:hypothetical protein